MAEILEVMKMAALNAVDASKPVQICFGEVKNIEPLSIYVEQKMLLDESRIILSKNVTDYELSIGAYGTASVTGEVVNAVNWAVKIANDDTHKYSQESRWGPDYDCSSFVISAYEQAGVPVKSDGATYTGDMKPIFLRNGFEDVTGSCNLLTGKGLRKGDVLLNIVHHAAMVQEDDGCTVEARGVKYGIVSNLAYRNYPWDCVLRYMHDGGAACTEFPKYTLSDSAITDIATCITGETGGTDIIACRQEASQIANLNEVKFNRSSDEHSIISTLHSGWYAPASWNRGCTDIAREAVKFVLIDGKRVLPRYVTEHDTFPIDILNAKVRENYKIGDSVHNRYGASYKFYCFFGEDNLGDIAGYFQNDYEKYRDDVPWIGGTGVVQNNKIIVNNSLVVGDRVILLRMQGGQKYIVMDKLV